MNPCHFIPLVKYLPWFTVIHLMTFSVSLKGDIIYLEKNTPYTQFRNVEKVNEKVFWVRGYADAIIALFEDRERHLFRVAIGRDSNSRSAIFADRNKVNETSNPVLLLEPNTYKFKPFWIKWTTDTFMFGAGSQVGEGVDLQWQGPTNAASIRYLSVRTRDIYPVEYILDLSCNKVPII
ncbi:hypothetical protein SNE40_000535 [Patella caerulea]|uniref:Farnesoic acid O-methyl transferase domain-containing protein n=1 Tax=Patella caerulea TaxID=87958 RepID=A0AAN8QH24_PATCE